MTFEVKSKQKIFKKKSIEGEKLASISIYSAFGVDC